MDKPAAERTPFISLTPLPLSLLPSHSSLPTFATALSIADFINAALADAATRLETLKDFNKIGDKSSGPSVAKISVGTLDGWAIRKSVHADRAEKGTASWAEFLANNAQNHSENEATYTPTIKWAHKVLEWEHPAESEDILGWKILEFAAYEMCHHLPFPLKDRMFSVVIISASRITDDSFTLISIPLADTHSLPGSKLANGDAAAGKTVLGRYAAVERLTRTPISESEDGAHQIEWVMGTKSDAGGNIPMWMQEKAVPGEIAKDVGLFLGWVRKETSLNSLSKPDIVIAWQEQKTPFH